MNNNLKTLFSNLKDDFDIEVPAMGHEQRFLAKLNNQNKIIVDNSASKRNWRKPLMSIAASIALIISILLITQQEQEIKDLASISPKLSQTQDYFVATIADELNKLENEKSPETEALIKDAKEQMRVLEENYETLKLDLTESGDDKRVIYAMITNFQNRIELLQTVLKNIENVKKLKQESDENATII